MRDPGARLADAARLFKERNAAYGSNYKKFGPVLEAVFPEGLHLKGREELGRMILFAHLFTKLTRYAMNIGKGGHEDSLDDMAVYAMMLAEHDEWCREHTKSETDLLDAKDADTLHRMWDGERRIVVMQLTMAEAETIQRRRAAEDPPPSSCEWSSRP
jgi:hypothetical protein